jgi:hypothetical protein
MKWTRAGAVAAFVAAAAMQSCQKETVTSVVVTEVIVEPAEASVVAGEDLSFSAVVVDENDALLNGATVAWSTDDALIISVDAQGRADAISAGSTRVVATYQGVAGSASVTVQPARCEPVSEAPKDEEKGKKKGKDGKKQKGQEGDDDDDEGDEGDEDDEDDEDDGDDADDGDDGEDEDDDEGDEEPGCQGGPVLAAGGGPLSLQDPT